MFWCQFFWRRMRNALNHFKLLLQHVYVLNKDIRINGIKTTLTIKIKSLHFRTQFLGLEDKVIEVLLASRASFLILTGSFYSFSACVEWQSAPGSEVPGGGLRARKDHAAGGQAVEKAPRLSTQKDNARTPVERASERAPSLYPPGCIHTQGLVRAARIMVRRPLYPVRHYLFTRPFASSVGVLEPTAAGARSLALCLFIASWFSIICPLSLSRYLRSSSNRLCEMALCACALSFVPLASAPAAVMRNPAWILHRVLPPLHAQGCWLAGCLLRPWLFAGCVRPCCSPPALVRKMCRNGVSGVGLLAHKTGVGGGYMNQLVPCS